MDTSKTIFVTGGTGTQGGAVISSLLNKGFKIKALTRKPGSEKAQQLLRPDVELIQGDLNHVKSFKEHLENTDGVFCVLSFEDGTAMEIKQGIALADVSRQMNIQHFVYSSVAGADIKTGIPHFESKNIIENHIRQSGLNYTILRPVVLYENFLIPQVRKSILQGKLASPVLQKIKQQFIGARDIGEITTKVFSDPLQYKGKILTIAAEQLNLDEAAMIFSDVMGKPVNYQKLPMLIVRLFMGKDLYKMFKWINTNDFILLKDIEKFKSEHKDLLPLRDWVKMNFKPE